MCSNNWAEFLYYKTINSINYAIVQLDVSKSILPLEIGVCKYLDDMLKSLPVHEIKIEMYLSESACSSVSCIKFIKRIIEKFKCKATVSFVIEFKGEKNKLPFPEFEGQPITFDILKPEKFTLLLYNCVECPSVFEYRIKVDILDLILYNSVYEKIFSFPNIHKKLKVYIGNSLNLPISIIEEFIAIYKEVSFINTYMCETTLSCIMCKTAGNPFYYHIHCDGRIAKCRCFRKGDTIGYVYSHSYQMFLDKYLQWVLWNEEQMDPKCKQCSSFLNCAGRYCRVLEGNSFRSVCPPWMEDGARNE